MNFQLCISKSKIQPGREIEGQLLASLLMVEAYLKLCLGVKVECCVLLWEKEVSVEYTFPLRSYFLVETMSCIGVEAYTKCHTLTSKEPRCWKSRLNTRIQS